MRAIILSRLARPVALTLTILLSAGGASAQLVSDGATATINGTATNIASFLTIGNTGPNTTLIVTNGGSVTADNAGIGGTTTSSNNLVAVSGAGSRMTTPGGGSVFRIGNGAAFNRLLISAGGAVTTGYGVVGFPVAASNNSVIVTGSGSAWTNSVLYVGEGAMNNSVIVANGGQVQTSFTSAIGVVASASNNWVTVTGPNSLWSTANNVLVGDADGQNRLFVNNGGKVTSGANIILGDDATSQNNLLSVAAGTATATNASGTGTLDVRRGTVEFNDGLIAADQLLLTNSAGSFTFNGGTLITRGATINNGQDFVVGANAGTGPAGATFANTTTTTIPSVGAATPYPSVINVANLGGIITKVTVTLSNLSHTFPGDLDVLLVGPDGQKVMLMSDAGDIADVIGVNLTFTDAAAGLLPQFSQITSGTYRPTDYVAGDAFPPTAPPGPYATNLATFNRGSANGAWSLYIVDDVVADLGSLGAWSLNIVTTPASANLANDALITINDSATATPYPSVINVTNLAGVVSRVTVTVSNFTHTGSFDADFLLVNPDGAAVALMRNAGDVPIAGATLMFDDAAVSTLPFSGPIVSGTYRPTSYLEDGSLPAPAPAGPYATELATFNGSNPNGVWSLFVNDRNGGSIGAISNGWSLQLETIIPATWDVRSNATPTTIAGDLIIGGSASNARLLITNGAVVAADFGYLGFNSIASNNVAVVAGPGSVWTNSVQLYVGRSGSGNQLVVGNGGVVATGMGFLGYGVNVNNNMAVVTGAGSRWNNSGELRVGVFGSGNQLVVSNGGVVANLTGTLGNDLSANNNVAVVTGAGSQWLNQSALFIGNQGSFNSLLISNDAEVVVSGGATIGKFSGANSNQVTVTGANSLLRCVSGSNLNFDNGSFNTLLITDGGEVRANNVNLKPGAAGGNLITLGNGIMKLDALLDIDGGSLVFNGGVIHSPQMWLYGGTFAFNSGTFSTPHVLVANGATFTVGDGTNAASYFMSGSPGNTHQFADDLVIANNATLSGNGYIYDGFVTVAPGGTLAPGSGIGIINLQLPPTLQGKIIMEITKSGGTVTNDLISIADVLFLGGSLVVSNLGPDALAAGDSFKLFSTVGPIEGAFATLTLPTLPTGLSWTNKLLVNGSIAVVTKTAPQISGLTKISTNLIYNVAGGSPGAPWYRLTSTNVALPLANWTTNGTGVFDWVGNATITNGINFAEPQRYFRISAP